MSITRATLPATSILAATSGPYDYVDSFEGDFVDPQGHITSTLAGKAFFQGGPKWIAALFALRNKIAGALGLKTGAGTQDRAAALAAFTCTPGETMGLFKVIDKSAQEVILGEDDRHLDFRVSIFLDATPPVNGVRKLTVSTTVVFKNGFGRAYFVPVRPFHKRIVPRMLRDMCATLEAEAGAAK